MTLKINETNFETEVANSNQPVLITFYASWCRTQRLLNMIEQLSFELNGIAKVVRVDVEESPNIAIQFDVSELPSFAVLDSGKIKSTRELKIPA